MTAIHFKISITLFTLCLFFPGFYINDSLTPWDSYGLLINGWMGFVDYQFAWFSNPCYFLAIAFYKYKPKVSILLMLVGLALALSFLFKKTVITNANSSLAPVTAYGWGYFLWIMSFVFLLFGLIEKLIGSEDDISIFNGTFLPVQVFVCVIAAAFFGYQYFFEEFGPYDIDKRRTDFMERNCPNVKEEIYMTPNKVTGIYYSNSMQRHFRKELLKGYRLEGGGAAGIGELNSGKIEFYEVDNEEKNQFPYKRFKLKDYKGKGTKKLLAEYSVISENLTTDLPKKLNIIGEKVTIIESETSSVIGVTSYYYNGGDKTGCFPSDEANYSVDSFVRQALGLVTNTYPSIYQ